MKLEKITIHKIQHLYVRVDFEFHTQLDENLIYLLLQI